MSIQGAINQAIGATALTKRLYQDSPGQVNKQVKTLMKTADSDEAKASKDWSKSIYNKMESLEGQYPLVKFPDKYLEAKTSLAERIKERSLQQSEVKQKRQSYLDQLGLNLKEVNNGRA